MTDENITAQALAALEPPTQPETPQQGAQQPEQQGTQQPEQQAQAANPYQSIIDQQGEQIAALIAANEALTKQVTSMIQNGAQLGAQPQAPQATQAAPTQQFNTPSLATDVDYSLESLAMNIGKK